MIRNIIIILTLALLTSCEYDYIHDDPNRPQEYCGNWVCDSTYFNGVKNNKIEKRNFSIMQTEVTITSAVDAHVSSSYHSWKLDETQTKFLLLNSDYVEILSFEIVRKPYKLALKDTANKVTYYLHD
jgi:hypothetical protein